MQREVRRKVRRDRADEEVLPLTAQARQVSQRRHTFVTVLRYLIAVGETILQDPSRLNQSPRFGVVPSVVDLFCCLL